MKIIGLTGGIASGKSTITQYLKHKRIPTIDADTIAKKILHQSQNEVVALLDTSVLTDNGELDTKAIRQLIFDDIDKKSKLEAFLHPKTKQAIHMQIQAIDAPCVVVEVPLLFEAGWMNEFDEIWLVYSTHQHARLIYRDKIDKTIAKRIIDQQNQAFDVLDKIKRTDVVIENNADIGSLHQAIEQLINPWLEQNQVD